MNMSNELIFNKKGEVMIEYNDFKEVLCDEIRKKLSLDGYNIELKISEVNTINSKKDKLSVINLSEPDAFPVFYLNDLYTYYCKCRDLFEVVEDVINEAKKTYSNLQKVNLDKEGVNNKVFFSLINCEKNEELLKTLPHREFHDLAVVYRVKISESTNALVTNKMTEHLQIDENELYDAAYKNTPKMLGNICKMELDEWYINEFKKIFDCNYHYQETKKSKFSKNEIFVYKYETSSAFGSSIVLYKDVLEKTAETLNDDLVMAFLSSDELIVASAAKEEELKNICKDNTIPLQKFLSNNIYIYDRKEKKISIQSGQLNKCVEYRTHSRKSR